MSSSRLRNSGLKCARTALSTASRFVVVVQRRVVDERRAEVGRQQQDRCCGSRPCGPGRRSAARRRAPAAARRRRRGAPSRPRRAARRCTAGAAPPRSAGRPRRTRRSREARRPAATTECFSPYSLMSMRTIARSSSNRNSASALASSVLPTPVGPRNRNEPVGRSGSEMPARARRTASDTARTASSWPTTPLAELVLHPQQLRGLALEQPAGRDAGPRRPPPRRRRPGRPPP